jgi:hypothetical protein
MKSPKTITILLVDGSPSGIKTAEIGNSINKAIVVPRSLIKEAAQRDELNGVGIYFLIGNNNETDLPDVYIGEAENVYDRIKQHNTKDFWNLAICFISKDQSLTKAHVKYLENFCYELADKIKRCSLLNSSLPAKAKLPETAIADAQDFFKNLKILISTLGYPIFDETSEASSGKKNLYYCKGPDANAVGEYTPEGFVVYKDSLARSKFTKTAGTWVEGMTSSLIEKGILSKENQESLKFTANFVFKSPSAAAATVLARRANGWIEWKDEKGNTLDKNERQI